MSVKRIECTIVGRVQLVMFRDYTCRNGRKFGLVGWVRNNADGSVSMVAEGEEEGLKKLIDKLWHGSLLSRVDDVSVTWSESVGDLHGFNIVYE